MWSWASPSPHGLIEMVFALPMIVVGLFVMGLAFIVAWRGSNWLVRSAGIVLVLTPLWVLAWLFLPFSLR